MSLATSAAALSTQNSPLPSRGVSSALFLSAGPMPPPQPPQSLRLSGCLEPSVRTPGDDALPLAPKRRNPPSASASDLDSTPTSASSDRASNETSAGVAFNYGDDSLNGTCIDDRSDVNFLDSSTTAALKMKGLMTSSTGATMEQLTGFATDAHWPARLIIAYSFS
ncbi:unnamed protein product [Protopolystoma xenopodis]|uniref:Uncharacterized protein n=1 Tax=Protopolystoma xenopodis TaxID=117903 RepID=A0A3S5BA74_9PLAT|nr:unnamed protein product [Protopolystoma xenopodis]